MKSKRKAMSARTVVQLRKAAGRTQVEFARDLGVAVSTLTGWESRGINIYGSGMAKAGHIRAVAEQLMSKAN